MANSRDSIGESVAPFLEPDATRASGHLRAQRWGMLAMPRALASQPVSLLVDWWVQTHCVRGSPRLPIQLDVCPGTHVVPANCVVKANWEKAAC